MNALIYVRAGTEDMADIAIKICKMYCEDNGLKVRGTYIDLMVRPSSPKSKWKGFWKLAEDLQEQDCIVCQRFKDLPDFLSEIKPGISIHFPGKKELFEKINSTRV